MKEKLAINEKALRQLDSLKGTIYSFGDYQALDKPMIDYGIEFLPGTQIAVRGPVPELLPNNYICCIGAAQTFGRYCADPFPIQLQRKTGWPVVNCGRAGAGPSFFSYEHFHPILNNAGLVIVQVMSGRSVGNSIMSTCGTSSCATPFSASLMYTDDAWKMAEKMLTRQDFQALLDENMAAYVADTIALARSIATRKILLWFSERGPDDAREISRSFPHFVNRAILDDIADYFDEYVECASSRGMPQFLYDKNGQPFPRVETEERLPINSYYPSPGMHDDCVASLMKASLIRSITPFGSIDGFNKMKVDEDVNSFPIGEPPLVRSWVMSSNPFFNWDLGNQVIYDSEGHAELYAQVGVINRLKSLYTFNKNPPTFNLVDIVLSKCYAFANDSKSAIEHSSQCCARNMQINAAANNVDPVITTGGLPDFLIVGFRKCGTSSLFDALLTHPMMLPPAFKEVNYFSDKRRFELGESWYRANFVDVAKLSARYVTGEATVWYIQEESALQRISELMPAVKMVVVLRDPVERFFSDVRYSSQVGEKNLQSPDKIRDDIKRLRDLDRQALLQQPINDPLVSGLYGLFVQRIYANFAKPRLLVIRLEELIGDPRTLPQVLQFLDLPLMDLAIPHSNVGERVLPKEWESLRADLEKFYFDDMKSFA